MAKDTVEPIKRRETDLGGYQTQSCHCPVPMVQNMLPFSTLMCDSIQMANQGRLSELSCTLFFVFLFFLIKASLQRQD